MIPSIPTLQRRPLRSAYTDAEYFFDTLITRYPAEPSAAGDHFLLESLSTSGAIAHERIHWMQHHGTTIGAFLSFVRYSQQMTVISWLADLPASNRRLLAAERLGGRSLLSFRDDDYALLPSSLNAGFKFDLLRQTWYDFQLVYTMFDSSPDQDMVPWSREEATGEIVGDVILHACLDYELATYPGNDLARRWYRFEDPVPFVAVASERLTTRGIFEGMATANEFSLILSYRSPSQALSVIRRLQEGSYGVAFSAFRRLAGITTDTMLFSLPTFTAICDLALNPPLPPYIMAPPVNRPSWDWSEIYPPMRFVQLARSVSRVGLLRDGSDHATASQYIDDLCSCLGWVNPLTYAHPYAQSNRCFDFSDFEPKDLQQGLAEKSWHEYLLWVQSKMWEERASRLPLFTSFGDFSRDTTEREIEILFGASCERWMSPQLFWTGDKFGYGLSKHFANWLLFSVAGAYFTFDVMVDNGRLSFDAFPPEVAGNPTFRGSIEQSIQNLF